MRCGGAAVELIVGKQTDDDTVSSSEVEPNTADLCGEQKERDAAVALELLDGCLALLAACGSVCANPPEPSLAHAKLQHVEHARRLAEDECPVAVRCELGQQLKQDAHLGAVLRSCLAQNRVQRRVQCCVACCGGVV